MITIESSTKVNKAELPRVFEVYFFASPEGVSATDMVFAKANKDYHSMFGYKGRVVHLAIRLGAFVYEVTSDGVEKYAWGEHIVSNPRLIYLYTLDIVDVSDDKKMAVLFTLENLTGSNLDIRGCLSYLFGAIGFGKSEEHLRKRGLSSSQNLNQRKSTFVKAGSKETYHLPFTCATLANVVLYHFIEFEPGFDGHLAQATQVTMEVLAACGYGDMFELGEAK